MGNVEVLQGFFKSGALGALIIDGAGQIEGEAFNEVEPIIGLSETVVKVLSVADELYNKLNNGELERQQVHFGPYQLHIESLGYGRTLVLVLGAKANLGRIRLEIRKCKTVLLESINK